VEDSTVVQLSDEYRLRFAGVGRVYADPDPENPDAYLKVLHRLHRATVAVIGLGGIGSWAAEALCRSGVGSIILIDLDDICISNTNRQVHAVSNSIGKQKIDEMKQRILLINPECNITLIHDFVTLENVEDIFDGLKHTDVVLDAIDGGTEKSALIAACVRREMPIVTCGGAAGRVVPTKVVSGDLVHAMGDRLLTSCKKTLRKYHGFTEGLPFQNTNMKKTTRIRKWGITAVYSLETQIELSDDDDVSALRRCDGVLGTACFVTGAFAFAAAGRVVEMLATGKTIKPRKRYVYDR
jgi:tRNA threonylcarbamoyladenosine dehydratase